MSSEDLEAYTLFDEAETDIALETEAEKNNNLRNKIQIEALDHHLRTFKTLLFKIYVQKDKNHNPDEIGALYTYHSLLLQSIAYWIGMLDDQVVPRPVLIRNKELETTIMSINTYLRELNNDSAVRQIAYNSLSKLAIEHPFVLV